jgi:F-type H+-transporting ATPase subunit alpha
VVKKLGGGVRLDLAQYRELAAFAQFASDLDEATRKQIDRGQRVTELMKQGQYAPMSIAQMAVSLFAVNNGFLDDVEASKVVDFEKALQDFMKSRHQALMDKINSTGDYNADIENGLKSAIAEFKASHTW